MLFVYVASRFSLTAMQFEGSWAVTDRPPRSRSVELRLKTAYLRLYHHLLTTLCWAEVVRRGGVPRFTLSGTTGTTMDMRNDRAYSHRRTRLYSRSVHRSRSVLSFFAVPLVFIASIVTLACYLLLSGAALARPAHWFCLHCIAVPASLCPDIRTYPLAYQRIWVAGLTAWGYLVWDSTTGKSGYDPDTLTYFLRRSAYQ